MIKDMMPKEKAEELIEKFSPLVTVWDCYYDTPQNPDLIRKDAIKCALVCVEEIINELEQLRKPEYTTFVTRYAESETDTGDTMDGYEKIEYWEQVKTELITT